MVLDSNGEKKVAIETVQTKRTTDLPDPGCCAQQPGESLSADFLPGSGLVCAPTATDLIEQVREFDKLEDDGGRGLPYKPRSIHVNPGEEVFVQFIPQTVEFAKPFRSSWHCWHSKQWLCPARTSEALTGGPKTCALCSLGLESRATWSLPVLLLGREIETQRGGIWKDYDGRQSYLLSVDGRLFEIIADLCKSNPEIFTWAGGAVWRIRRGADWSWHVQREASRPVTRQTDLKQIYRSFQAPKVRLPQFDHELIAAIRANLNHTPEAGRVENLINAMSTATFVPMVFGTKTPLLSGYMDFGAQQMHDARYLEKLERSNIALLCGPSSGHICSVDVDTDEGLEPFVEVNPWAHQAQFSRSRRGGNFYFRMMGDYAPEVFRLLQGETQWGEVRLGRCLTTVSGYHPCGKPYVVENLGAIPEITLEDLKLPAGIEIAASKRSKRNYTGATGDGVCRLNLDRLAEQYGLHEEGGKLIARCPACAEHGQDRKGQHLVIYPNGAYTCIVCRDTQQIYELVGRKNRGRQQRKETAC